MRPVRDRGPGYVFLGSRAGEGVGGEGPLAESAVTAYIRGRLVNSR